MSDNNDDLKKRLDLYEQNGPAKLYYSLNRKANEMDTLLTRSIRRPSRVRSIVYMLHQSKKF